MVEDVITPCLQIGLSVTESTGAGFGVLSNLYNVAVAGRTSDNG